MTKTMCHEGTEDNFHWSPKRSVSAGVLGWSYDSKIPRTKADLYCLQAIGDFGYMGSAVYAPYEGNILVELF